MASREGSKSLGKAGRGGSRTKLASIVETAVLAASRRRCALCFGLDRDMTQKPGQIAHINRDHTDNALDNLVFLCLEHHDAYDRRTSQSKGLTDGELRHFKRELEAAIAQWLKAFPGATVTRRPGSIDGRFVRPGSFENAELEIATLPSKRVHVSGIALWGSGRPEGPHLGHLDFVAALSGGVVDYRKKDNGNDYRLTLKFDSEGLSASEQRDPAWYPGPFGMNVSFSGRYQWVDSTAGRGP